MEKIKSSKALKESMQNVDRVIENELLDTHVEIDPILADAYEQDKEIELHVEETLDELNKKGEEVVEDTPEAPMPVSNAYTEQFKLDESLQDFSITEARSRVAARDENDGDKYLDYDMLEFVYELLSSGSKGITNIAPKTPMVHRKKNPKDDFLSELPMKKFSPNGSQIINKYYVYLLDLAPTESKEIKRNIAKIPERAMELIKRYAYKIDENSYLVEEMFEQLCERLPNLTAKLGRDAIGYAMLNHCKTQGSPQISEAGNKVVVYSDDLDDFTQAAEGLLDAYGITCEAPVPKRNKSSHWDYSMVVNVPCYSDGEPMSLEDWLEDTGRSIDDVMDEKVAKSFKNSFAKADKANDEVVRKIIYDKFAAKAYNAAEDELAQIADDYCKALEDKGLACSEKDREKFISNMIK